ncbi:transcriptional activator of glycolytic enzymes-domain-containing protein [Limtongia smithiae]|uniref:transcriptional activator of glycolytic enzymes-domain-containing protein n=1 Tax=Limtongia smithiae TaxID=1125753 RepID=UPI0034CF2837
MPRAGDMPRWGEDRILNDPAPPSTVPGTIINDDQVRGILSDIRAAMQSTANMTSNVILTRFAEEMQYISDNTRAERQEVSESINAVNAKLDDLLGQVAVLADDMKALKREFAADAERTRHQMRADYSAVVDAMHHAGSAPGSGRSIGELDRDLELIDSATRRMHEHFARLREPPARQQQQQQQQPSPQRLPAPIQPPQMHPQLARPSSLAAQQQQPPQPQPPQQQQPPPPPPQQVHQPLMQQQPIPQSQSQQPPPQPPQPPQQPPQHMLADRRSESTGLLYVMAVNVRSVKDMWIEYAVGVAGGPSIRSLENQHGTAWRGGARSAQSRKFQRQRAVYDAVEKGMSTGRSADECCHELEQLRIRPDGKWHSLTWLLHNIPTNMFE